MRYDHASPFATLFQVPAQTEMPAIPKFLQVTPQFCTRAQPRLEAFAKLKADGVKVRAQPAAAVRASRRRRAGRGGSGRDEGNIPVVYANPTDAEADAFLKITDDRRTDRCSFIARRQFESARSGRSGGPYAMASRRMLRSKKAGKSASSSAPHLEEFARKSIASHQPRK